MSVAVLHGVETFWNAAALRCSLGAQMNKPAWKVHTDSLPDSVKAQGACTLTRVGEDGQDRNLLFSNPEEFLEAFKAMQKQALILQAPDYAKMKEKRLQAKDIRRQQVQEKLAKAEGQTKAE